MQETSLTITIDPALYQNLVDAAQACESTPARFAIQADDFRHPLSRLLRSLIVAARWFASLFYKGF